MTRDDITRMAREAGFVGMDGEHGALRRFAALVAAAEREACAKEAQDRIDRLYAMYEQVCQQRDHLMAVQDAKIALSRGRMQ